MSEIENRLLLAQKKVRKYILRFEIETEHFIVKYNEIEKSCICGIMNLLEKSYAVITERLSKELEQKTIVEICSDKKELYHVLGIKDGPEWIRGGVASGRIVIISPLNPPPGSDYYNVVNTVVHEFVHVIISAINKKIPRWLDEGIASYEGRDNNSKWIENTIREGLKSGNVPTLTELDTGDDFGEFFNRDGYQYSYAIIEFIIAKFGYKQLIELVTNPADFEGILKMTEAKFQSEWMDFLKGNYGCG